MTKHDDIGRCIDCGLYTTTLRRGRCEDCSFDLVVARIALSLVAVAIGVVATVAIWGVV